MASGAMIDRTSLFSLMAADAEFMAGFPVEFDVTGRAVMTVGAGELVTVEPMVENYIAVKCFVGESRNADSPSEKQKHGDVESFHSHVPFGLLIEMPPIIVLSWIHCQGKLYTHQLKFQCCRSLINYTYSCLFC